MTPMLGRLAVAALCLACFAQSGLAQTADEPLPRATPDAAGFSPERLARLDAALKEDVAQGRIPGAVVAIARHGKLVMLNAYGWRDKAANQPMTVDSIFNVASMTKPMTTVGALTLYEKGQLLMEDQLAKYFPKFAGQKVAARDAKGEPTTDLVAARRAITVQDLLRHTSGIIYGGRGTTLVHKQYPGGSVDAAGMTGEAFIDKLAAAPLLHQPGSTWDYGFGLDLTGLIIEQQTKMSLGAYLQQVLFTPLGMKDTGFFVPADKAARYAKPLPADPTTDQAQTRSPDLTQKLGFECGGGCASSTALDYLRFAEMLRNGGRFNGTQVLAPRTVAYMLSNQLGPNVVNLIGNADPTRADFGFGLGLAVRTTSGIVAMMGSPGQFTWPGASGTDWWVDPKEELSVVYMSAAPGPTRWLYRQKINALVYQALED